MKSGTRNVVIVAVCAVVLGGTVFALTRTSTGSSSSSTSSSQASIQLISKSSSNVVSMKVTNKKGSYTLIPQPSGTSSAASSASSASSSPTVNYTVEGLSGCPVNTSETSSVVQNGFSLTATKNLGTVSSLSDYGLQNPQATVEVKFKDGSSYNYKIGNATATDSSAYYMCGTNSSTVYVVSIDQGLLENENYFISKDMLAIQASSTASSSTTNGSSSVNFTQINLSGSNFPTPVTLQGNSGAMSIVSPAAYGADSTNLSAMESVLTTLSADSVVAVNPDAAALKKYGFNNPIVTADFTAEKKRYKLTIGAANGKDYYAMIDGVNVVYNVSSDGISGLVSQNLFNLRDKLILTPNIETVKAITVTSGRTTDNINVTRTENTASSTQDKKAYNYKVTGNGGKSLQYDTNYRNLYERLIGITFFSDTNKAPSGNLVASIQYSYFDKAGTDKIELYQTDDRHCTILLNGKVWGLCVKSDVDSVLQSLTQFENGQTIPQT